MVITDIKNVNHPCVLKCREYINNHQSFRIKGLYGSSYAVTIASVKIPNWQLVVLPNTEMAMGLYSDLSKLCPDDKVLIYPSVWQHTKTKMHIDEGNLILRTEVLEKLMVDKANSGIIICDADAIAEKILSDSDIEKHIFPIQKGEKITMSFLRELLEEYGFQLTEFVYEPGQFAIRGSILDVFSYSAPHPYRLDFFGSEVESIRTFNSETQLSEGELQNINIIPNIQRFDHAGGSTCITQLLPKDSIIWNIDPALTAILQTSLRDVDFRIVQDLEEETKINTETIYWTREEIERFTQSFLTIEMGNETFKTNIPIVEFHTQEQPTFNKNFEQLSNNIQHLQETGITCHILSDNLKQFNRLREIFNNLPNKVDFTPINGTLHKGFIDYDVFKAYYTDHEIFDRYHSTPIRKKFHKSESLTIEDFQSLHPGDYIVHIDHGVGIFGGMEKINNNGKIQETIRLVYKDKDILYVSLQNLHKISKYRSKDGEPPKIYKLGTPAWQNLKNNTKRKIKDIAKDLIALYAKRKASQGFAFSPDSGMQQELEASFIYEDTPDQQKAIQSVKAGMEAPYPMDHLVCGDVGFGKTEVAIRAAFKAIVDNKQVAVLVPTTLLAFQHFQTFSSRLKDWPITVEYLCRLRTAKEQKDILKRLEEGKIDILIGTHKIVGKDVKFKDLGLLIIDEEQRFGVAVKEKLKTMRVNVDTLVLTATPIPRTLQFSLLGARDLSVINTPPPNRHPVYTEVSVFDKDLIQEAIQRELDRGGQVFYIHQRIGDLLGIQNMLHELCPQARSVIAHGQMDGRELENIMLDFLDGEYDILISTSIVESGIDIPTANTIFISKAHMFGLSDLHQLRGRVGRSNKKAYCYLMVPPIEGLTPDARRRIRAIEQFSELGSGFNIAMQDLDIRGAGNLIGAEQSGFISDIGFETYQRILDEAMTELREEEYVELLSKPDTADKSITSIVQQEQFVTECQIDSDMEALLPDAYVENVTERIKLYRELDNINNIESLNKFSHNLQDRFGPLPTATKELIKVVELRLLAVKLSIEKIVIRNNQFTVWFVSNPHSPFYKSQRFSHILEYVIQHPRIFTLKETKEKFSMTVKDVKSINSVYEILSKLLL